MLYNFGKFKYDTNRATFSFKDQDGFDILIYNRAPDSDTFKAARQIANVLVEHTAKYERLTEYLMLVRDIPDNLPIYLISGSEDASNNMTKNLFKLIERYIKNRYYGCYIYDL